MPSAKLRSRGRAGATAHYLHSRQVAKAREAIEAAGESEAFPEPKDWESWVRTIELKSGSSIKQFSPMSWQSEVADLIINRQAGKRKSYVFAKSRQAGASTEILSIVDYLAVKKPQLTALFLHKTYGDSAELGKRNRKLLRAAKVPLQSDAALCQVLGNGSTIYYRSGDPDTAGRGLDSVDIVVYEECSFYSDLKGCVETIGPAQSWCEDAISIFVTTPNGKIGPGEFYWRLLSGGNDSEIEGHLAAVREGKADPCQIIGENDPITRIIVHWRAVEPFANEPDFKRRIMAESGMTEESFAQEYDLDFSVKSEDSIFSFSLVQSCLGRKIEKDWLPDPEATYWIGVDPSGVTGGDYSAAVVLEEVNNRYLPVEIFRKKSGTAAEHLSAIAKLAQKWQPLQITVESNGVGSTWAEQLSGLNLAPKIVKIATTASSKPTLISRVKLGLERGEIEIPPGSILEQELLSFRQVGKQMQVAQGGHDDVLIALCLAAAPSGLNAAIERLSVFSTSQVNDPAFEFI
jgi:hypothetical protein